MLHGLLNVKLDKFTLTVRNHEGIMSSLTLQISNICVFDYTLFQRLLQLLCSRTNARTIFQEYTKFKGDYLFDIFPAALNPPAKIYVRHILGISGKVFFHKFLLHCDFEMLFPLSLKIQGLQHFSGTDHCELENH
jgi:hypothetical protein